jgi:hypothetical protein
MRADSAGDVAGDVASVVAGVVAGDVGGTLATRGTKFKHMFDESWILSAG